MIALIGERNREVRDFLENDLGPDGMKRSVVIAATSDMPAPLRIRAAFVALAVSEYFRDQGKSVLLVMDSVTRLAMAQREIGLAAGEPPSQKGYTPSVFNLLPKVFERAGNFKSGSITGFFTVLVEGDDFNEPICDAARAILDGHIVLSRELGAMGHYPRHRRAGIPVSRLEGRVAKPEQREAARLLRGAMAEYQRSEDLINLGAYAAGSNPRLDTAIRLRPKLLEFLRQRPDASEPLDQTLEKLAMPMARPEWRKIPLSARSPAWSDRGELQARIEETKLEQLHGEIRGIEARQAELNGQRTESEKALLDAPSVTGLQLAELDVFQRFSIAENARLERRRVECGQRIAAQIQLVAEKRRDVRLLERLKEQRLKTWNTELGREIDAQADEAHLAKWKPVPLRNEILHGSPANWHFDRRGRRPRPQFGHQRGGLPRDRE